MINPSSSPRPRRRLALAGIAGATLVVASCDTSLAFRPNELLWGFVTVAATSNGGAIVTAPNAVFFRGEVTGVPNSGLRPDSCFPAQNYVPPVNDFTGVTYLDAGPAVGLRIGQQTNDLPRVSSGGTTTYRLGAGTTIPYGSGDSIVVTIPGANGGYPAAEIRGKAAEALDMDDLVASTTESIPLRWNAAPDTGSAIVLSLRFAPSGGAVTREIRCAFRDDGADAIRLAQHLDWSNAPVREVTATRLRTVLRNVGDGGLQLISTYSDPIPQQ